MNSICCRKNTRSQIVFTHVICKKYFAYCHMYRDMIPCITLADIHRVCVRACVHHVRKLCFCVKESVCSAFSLTDTTVNKSHAERQLLAFYHHQFITETETERERERERDREKNRMREG